MKNGHRKRIISENVLQDGDFSKRRGFAVLVTYGRKKTEVIENDYVTVSCEQRFLSCMTSSVYGVVRAACQSRSWFALYARCKRQTSARRVRHTSINAHAPIKDGTVFRHQFVFAWTGKNDSKTQRVGRKKFPFSNKN